MTDEPYPGKDAGEHVTDPSGNYKGQCVSLGKARCPGLPSTSHYRGGVWVQGNNAIPVGTLIVALKNGQDWGGGGHLAIYLRQDPVLGVEVTDQYVTGGGRKVGRHFIGWDGRKVSPSVQSQGRNYQVLVTVD